MTVKTVKDVVNILHDGSKQAAQELATVGVSLNHITEAPRAIVTRIRAALSNALSKTGINLMNAKVADLSGNTSTGTMVSGAITDKTGQVTFNVRDGLLGKDVKRTVHEEAAHSVNRLKSRGQADLTTEQHEALAGHVSATQEGEAVVYDEHTAALNRVVKSTGVSADELGKAYLKGQNKKIIEIWDQAAVPANNNQEYEQATATNDDQEYRQAA